MPQLTWLITGCSSGLGEAFVRCILARGDRAIATTRGDISRVSALAEAGARTYSLDVTASKSEIDAVVQDILKEGDIDVLVNNAGYIEAGIAEEASIENYLSQFDTNFFGVIKVTQAILPHFRHNRKGTVVFIGSFGGIAGEPGAAPYCATKHALEGWNDCLRQEVAHLNIKTIIFELGFFRTQAMHPSKIKFGTERRDAVADYDAIREGVEQFVKETDGNQIGDAKKAVGVMVDVVKGEGVAAGKVLPERLPLGRDCLEKMKGGRESDLKICDEWEQVITSTDLDD